MSFSKEIAQQIQELGMAKIGPSNTYFVEWENDERIAAIMINPNMGVWWEVDAFPTEKWDNSKLYDGVAFTPFDAVDAINECISDNALGLTIEIAP